MSANRSTRGSGSTPRPEPSKLLQLFAGMKVWQLARLAGISVGEVVSIVVREDRLPAFPRRRKTKRRGGFGPGQLVATDEPEPDLGALVGLPRREVKALVDRWVLGRVLARSEGNISHAAAELQISRRTLRERWNAVRDLPVRSLPATPEGRGPSRNVTAAPSLAELLERGASRREIHRVIDRWLVEIALDDTDGNVTYAARGLNTSRRVLRGIRDRS